MPKMMITKQEGFANPSCSLTIPELKTGSYGTVDFTAAANPMGIAECHSENKLEAYASMVGYRYSSYDEEWEHLRKATNPDDFPAPEGTFYHEAGGSDGEPGCPLLLGSFSSFWSYSKIGTSGGDYAVLDNTNHDLNETGISATIYNPSSSGGGSATGPNGFIPPPTGGLASVGGEVVHYGSLTTSSIGAMGRVWGAPGIGALGGPPYWGFIHYGHDYEANPTPPPATVLHRVHESVNLWYPPRWISHWMATSFTVEPLYPVPVGYTPKGGKLGIFMPIILRFLIHKRKRDRIVSIKAGVKP